LTRVRSHIISLSCPGLKIIPKEALSGLAPALLAQDSQAAVKKRAAGLKALDHKSEAVVTTLSSRDVVEPSVENTESRRKQGCKILLLVKDNAVCRQAFRLCTSLIGREDGDALIIMTLKEPTSYGIAEGQKLLRTFSHITCDHITTRMVGDLSDKLIDSLVAAIDKVNPDLVVVGSESLANAGSTPFYNPATSICYCLAKASIPQSLLVVKTNSAGSLFSLSEASLAGEPGPVKIAMEAGPTLAMLSWVLSRCTPGRDSLALVRRSFASPPL
jgi:hypothetical protein